MKSDLRLPPANSRREFLKRGTSAAVALPAVLSSLGACGDKAPPPAQAATPTAPVAPPSAQQRADEMDAMHEKGVKAFPAKTEGQGNQLLKPRIEKGVKIFDLTA